MTGVLGRREMTVSDSIWVDVAPEVAYDAVSDVTQMGRWSPENTGARVASSARRAHVGMTFVGDNRRGPARWQTRCTVTAADRGSRFAFDVHRWGVAPCLLPVAVASWAYAFEARDGGTLVTETWRDGRTRWPHLSVRVFDPLATGRASFADFQRSNIARTLRNLKRELESA
ncbi:SRPBCC family protein [Nocardioides jiangxiensis]|uniref:SRPBCC family protein n=1 Tax=Nocardioides jiangxiensis TaxID=3064524 RepID=A0ABT9B3B6_9ACTN|nr:SRPBCC family protein [Nocardioides sp. WY-20]MDO7869212.1 SRPBCC family protein [Nocardioides sp. WY-20]